MKKRIKNKNDRFSQALDFLSDSKKYIYASIILFFASALIGFFFASHFSFIEKILQQLVDETYGLGTLDLIVFIFWNNLKSAFIGLALGIAFGIMPIINAVSNGVVLGYVFNKIYNISGFADFWRILPHGIFELPAIFISLGMGMKLGSYIFTRKKNESLLHNIKRAFYAFVLVVVPLLIIAAIIEGLLINFTR